MKEHLSFLAVCGRTSAAILFPGGQEQASYVKHMLQADGYRVAVSADGSSATLLAQLGEPEHKTVLTSFNSQPPDAIVDASWKLSIVK